jgi:hypothetical protein
MEAYSWEGCWENIIELLLPEFPAIFDYWK